LCLKIKSKIRIKIKKSEKIAQKYEMHPPRLETKAAFVIAPAPATP
jgi:hypothetical protein